jgi:hypothetical protein
MFPHFSYVSHVFTFVNFVFNWLLPVFQIYFLFFYMFTFLLHCYMIFIYISAFFCMFMIFRLFSHYVYMFLTSFPHVPHVFIFVYMFSRCFHMFPTLLSHMLCIPRTHLFSIFVVYLLFHHDPQGSIGFGALILVRLVLLASFQQHLEIHATRMFFSAPGRHARNGITGSGKVQRCGRYVFASPPAPQAIFPHRRKFLHQ